MSQVHDELAALTADIQACLEWSQLTGASALPRERVEPLVAEPINERRTVGPEPVSARRVEPSVVTPKPTQKPAPVKASRPPESNTPQSPITASAKWAALIDAPTTHTVSGPEDARLLIVRGAGSSAEAESMLDRMLVNVLQVGRDQVAVFDLIRDTRSPADIGEGVRRGLEGYSPKVILVMGTFAAKALLNEDASVRTERGQWVSDPDLGVLRVTHHPEGILAMAVRGDASPKREAFDDLKAVASRLS